MTTNLKRLRTLLRPLHVMHSTDGREVLTLWCDAKDPSEEWARPAASVHQNPSIVRWLTDGPAAATAVADELERLRMDVAELRRSEQLATRAMEYERDRLANVADALDAAGFPWKVDDDGDIAESMAERVARALAGRTDP